MFCFLLLSTLSNIPSVILLPVQQRSSYGPRHTFSGHKPLITFFSYQIEKKLKCCSDPPSPPVPFTKLRPFTCLMYFKKVIWGKGTQKLLCPSPLKTFLAHQWRNQEATLPLPCYNLFGLSVKTLPLPCYNSCKACAPPKHYTQKLLCPSPPLPKPFCHIKQGTKILLSLPLPSPLKTFLSYQREGSLLPCPSPLIIFSCPPTESTSRKAQGTPLNLKWQ